MYLAALEGKGAHLATVNDYLARRDAEWMRPIYESLGMTVGVVETQMPQPERRKAYACDITYGTAKEFGFDFLRDRLLLRRIGEGQTDFLGGMLGQRPEAAAKAGAARPRFHAGRRGRQHSDRRSPHAADHQRAADRRRSASRSSAYKWAASVASEFEEDEHYEYDHENKTVELTAEGRQLVRTLPKPDAMHSMGMFTIYEYIERAIKVEREFFRDRQYVVRDGEIVIVDEFTGRLAEGRKWRAGLHQAVEANEGGVEVTVETGQAARITVQDYFLLYPHLAGMTGTAIELGRRAAQDLQAARGADSHQPAGDSRALARPRVRHGRGQVAGHLRRSMRVAFHRAGRC